MKQNYHPNAHVGIRPIESLIKTNLKNLTFIDKLQEKQK